MKKNYKLCENIALRSFRLVPYCLYIYGVRNAVGLTKEEFEILQLCDGGEVLETPLLKGLAAKGYCKPCHKGDTITAWQQARTCDNRYFPALNWTITGRCNFNCRHCFMAADNAPNMSQFTFDQCITLLDEMEECGIQTVSLTGGEPMLHPNFPDIVKECVKRHIYINEVITNGSFITKEILCELQKLAVEPLFKISFDGLGHHDWLRGAKGTEQKTLAAIELCHEMGFRVRVQMNLHKGNIETLMPTAVLLDGMGIEELRIIRTTEAPRWEQNGKD